MSDTILAIIIYGSMGLVTLIILAVILSTLDYIRTTHKPPTRYISRIPDEYLEYRAFPQPRREWSIKPNSEPKSTDQGFDFDKDS